MRCAWCRTPLVETTSFTRNAQAMVHAEVALPEDAPEWAENAFGRAALADALRLVRADVQAQDLDMSEAAMQRAAMARVSERLWNAVEYGEHPAEHFSDPGAVCAQPDCGAAP